MAKKRITVIVIRGNQSNEQNAEKMNQMEIIMRLVHRCMPKSEFMMDDATIMLELDNDEPGDPRWVEDNVLNRVYIDSVRGSAECIEKCDRLYAICEEKGGVDKVRLGLIQKFLNDFYLAQRSASIYIR